MCVCGLVCLLVAMREDQNKRRGSIGGGKVGLGGEGGGDGGSVWT